jgi:CheY-like chemotaxis protein
MKKFNILVVDDDPSHLQRAAAVHNPDGLTILQANSLSKAKELARKHFLHAAFVDIQLVRGDTGNRDGIRLIKYLSTFRPACRLLVITGTLEVHWGDVVAVSHLLDGIYRKDELADEDFVKAIQRLYRDWVARDVAVTIDPPIGDEFFRKAEAELARGPKEKHQSPEVIKSTQDELEYLVARVFGQTGEAGDWDMADVSAVALRHIPKGKSGSVVLKAYPETGSRRRGVVSVIKIGTKTHAHREFANFRRFVRFGRRHDRHVDLLGHEFGDTLGVLCYSFAGAVKGEDVIDLDSLLRMGSPLAVPVLRRLFDADEADFYKMDAEPQSLADYFARTYPGRTTARAVKAMSPFRAALKEALRAAGDGSAAAELDGYPAAADILAKPLFRDPQPWVIVHGDLHAGNVFPGIRPSAHEAAGADRGPALREALLAGENPTGEVILIDYFYTGPGPRCIDFAAMESSVRLATLPESAAMPQVFGRRAGERKVWDAVWGGSASDTLADCLRRFGGAPEYWEGLSILIGHLARKNFPDLQAEEYAATCQMWVMRIFPLSFFTQTDQAGLMAWYGQLSWVLATD